MRFRVLLMFTFRFLSVKILGSFFLVYFRHSSLVGILLISLAVELHTARSYEGIQFQFSRNIICLMLTL